MLKANKMHPSVFSVSAFGNLAEKTKKLKLKIDVGSGLLNINQSTGCSRLGYSDSKLRSKSLRDRSFCLCNNVCTYKLCCSFARCSKLDLQISKNTICRILAPPGWNYEFRIMNYE